MSLTYWIPFFIVVLGNIGYHMVAKATPTAAPPFLALSVTYLVSFLLCAAAYVVTGTSLRQAIENILFSADTDVNTQKALKKLDEKSFTESLNGMSGVYKV